MSDAFSSLENVLVHVSVTISSQENVSETVFVVFSCREIPTLCGRRAPVLGGCQRDLHTCVRLDTRCLRIPNEVKCLGIGCQYDLLVVMSPGT